ncbi:hypothetical protein N9142_00800 [Akkermansiaceae bacterium]|nr:hypothetical protein [Akkermansiaceae bacterium]MDB4433658.1 hypothetical protein [Akkermansiaceae bacterium]
MFRFIGTSLLTFSFASALAALPEKETFNKLIRPILSDKCFSCHGFDKNTREADLRLDTAEGAASVVKPGDPNTSELFLRINAHDPDELMPPPESIKKLTDADRSLHQEVDRARRGISGPLGLSQTHPSTTGGRALI